MVPILFYLGYELLSLSFKYFIRNGNKCVWYIVYGMCWVYYVRCTVYVWVCVWRVVIWFRCHFRLSVGDTCLSRPGHSSYPDDHWHSWGGYQFTYAPYMLTHYWHYIYIYLLFRKLGVNTDLVICRRFDYRIISYSIFEFLYRLMGK